MDSSAPQPQPQTPAPAGPPPLYPSPPPPARIRTGRGWKILAFVLALLLVLSLFSNLQHAVTGVLDGGSHGARFQETVIEDNRSLHKVLLLPVEGIISSDGLGSAGYGLVEAVTDQLDRAADDPRIKAVLLKVNSPGGEVLASDDIARAIEKFQKRSGKPVIASMSSLAASGGYYVSAPCRWIVANELTITGSIGVIMHSYNYRGLMKKVGLAPQIFKSGKFKDMLSGEKDLEKLTPAEEELYQEERLMVQRMVDETFEKFKSVVVQGRQEANRQNRNSKDSKGQPLISDWTKYADGRVLSGTEAHRHGFVDELGNLETALARTLKLVDIPDANLVQYQQLFDFSSFLRMFGKAQTASVKVDLGMDVPKLKAGHLYFLSPTFVH